ncbi:hypothetical protein ACVIGA_000576 [Bradyrhizobium sp. USDA 3240]
MRFMGQSLRAVAPDGYSNPSMLRYQRRYNRVLLRMDALTLFGLFAVTMMLVCYAAEDRSPWFILAFAVSCALGSAYGFLQGAWPFGLVEAIWAVVAARRWLMRRTAESV